ncbi:MAG: glycine/betaine/sarcosine/D-proline family reductase selenoprotein B [Deltaproteobacteria bacterium]|nr:glycine/betaine/sarcosine/D-proline family reductase selenoprotein B [Deltaproteobacteria bacterium]
MPFFTRLMAVFYTRFRGLANRAAKGLSARPQLDIPWTLFIKPLKDSRIAIITTAGVHRSTDRPFDMSDADGDPTFRVINADTPVTSLKITHDYYDHRDADKDINVVFPIERLRELEKDGVIGGVAMRHFGLMGHIKGRFIKPLVETTASEIARMLKEDKVDAVVLTPG